MVIDLKSIKEKLYTAVISDVMDDLGFSNYWMDINIRPLEDDSILVGKARTMVSEPVNNEMQNPFDIQIDATDRLNPDEIVVAFTNNVQTSAFWGELFSYAAKQNGVNGAVIDGYVRDVRKIKELKFPIFSKGIHPGNSKNRQTVTKFDEDIICGGVKVRSGDYIFAEIDGCMVIPYEIAPKVFELALEVATKEQHLKNALSQGQSLREAYNKYRVI